MQTLNYKVYYMKPLEKIIYFIIAFAVGAAVGYLFYGGIGKDEFGQPTKLTYTLNVIISSAVGLFAGIKFIPIRTSQIIASRAKKLNSQFRDMLEALNTSLGAGKNVVDSFHSVYDDLKMQYDEGAYILKELEIIVSGMANNIDLEDLLEDFGRRSGNDDIVSFANVFKISYRKGGNIKETIRNTYEILTDKMEIREEIETVVTGNKSEQNIMIVMPIALIGVIKMMSPDFAANFTTLTGVISTTVAVILFVIAYFIGKIVLDIKV
ncbi:MAG: type II secretion system F family protein [Ruminococcus sp.]|nr:type II secretion system F family protein [Ruminococcus sp.]